MLSIIAFRWIIVGDQFRREATRVDVRRTELDATDSLSERRSYTPPQR